MFACVCKAVTVDDVESALVAGAATVPAIQQMTGAATCCGRCGPFIRQLVAQGGAVIPDELPVHRYVPEVARVEPELAVS